MNTGPFGCKPNALTAELAAHILRGRSYPAAWLASKLAYRPRVCALDGIEAPTFLYDAFQLPIHATRDGHRARRSRML